MPGNLLKEKLSITYPEPGDHKEGADVVLVPLAGGAEAVSRSSKEDADARQLGFASAIEMSPFHPADIELMIMNKQMDIMKRKVMARILQREFLRNDFMPVPTSQANEKTQQLIRSRW